MFSGLSGDIDRTVVAWRADLHFTRNPKNNQCQAFLRTARHLGAELAYEIA
jgi:hypothetical protein